MGESAKLAFTFGNPGVNRFDSVVNIRKPAFLQLETSTRALPATFAVQEGGAVPVAVPIEHRPGWQFAVAFIASVMGSAIGRSTGARRRRRRAAMRGKIDDARDGTMSVVKEDVGVVLLSAGKGSRTGAKIPKQYLKLLGREIALRSLDIFLACPEVAEIVIVCADEWRSVFQDDIAKRSSCNGRLPTIKFAEGGKERQDSVRNGLSLITSEFVAVHDSARPLVTLEEVRDVFADARAYGAALLGAPIKATVKQTAGAGEGPSMVAETPDRRLLWEAHTPQVVRRELLWRGFERASDSDAVVTDDASLIESLGEPVKLTEGGYANLKVTTPEDMDFAEAVLRRRGCTE